MKNNFLKSKIVFFTQIVDFESVTVRFFFEKSMI